MSPLAEQSRLVIETKSPREIEHMRAAGAIVAECLRGLKDMAQPGVTTAALDAEAERLIRSRGGQPEFKGYRGYPNTICASINEEVVHGLPSQRKLVSGDLLSIDVGVRYRKFVGDAAITVGIGTVDPVGRRLMAVCREALGEALSVLKAGLKLSELCGAIQRYVESRGCSVVRKYTGHGIGRRMHEDPQIPNFVCDELLANDVLLPAGATLAIEPMVNVGGPDTAVLSNRWTVVTRDRSLSAHFEHTVAVTEDGASILTA